ncbi:iron hydrogenase small subunit [Candidatus Micrarchaeota archaeon]|jgi:iron only hydrogenase large subunit-like protein|nr:iron hydrogenase small subunit [Candidatus Micrarchaeota archaeon]
MISKDSKQVLGMLENKKTIMVAQIAPAVRVSMGEEFGYNLGTEITEKLISALKQLGFDYVFDTCFGADVVTLEEAYELDLRIKNNGPFPLMTSCCIGWRNHGLQFYPQKLKKLSTCMAPQITLGALINSYLLKYLKVKDDKKVGVVSIMPCILKKQEAKQEATIGLEEVNFVLTTKECADLLKYKNIDLKKCGKTDFDKYLGHATQAGKKFGATGGVLEAVINTYAAMKGDKTRITIDDDKPLNEYSVNIDGKKLNIAKVWGLQNLDKIIEQIKCEKKEIHLIEVMACPFGCVGGPGQPTPVNNEKNKKRANALRKYAKQENMETPYDNKDIRKIYNLYLDKIGTEKTKELLHMGFIHSKIKNNLKR